MTRRARRRGASTALSLVVFTATSVQAMTLDEALHTALAKNAALAGKIVDVDVADARTLQAAGLDDFSVNAGATWTHSRGSNVAAQSTPLLPYDSVDVNASLTRPLSTGGTVALKLDAPYVRLGSSLVAGAPGDTGPIDAYQPSAQLSLTQPLLRGRGYDVARAPQRQARAQRDVAGWALEEAASELARDVSFAYWELAYQSGDHDFRLQALEAARMQLRAVNAQIDVGKQPPSASAEVEVSIAQREDEAIDSESTIVERASELARLLGTDRATVLVTLRATDAPAIYAPPDTDLVARALDRNAQIASLRAQATATTIDVDVAKSALSPQLDAFVSGGPRGVATDPSPALRSLATLGAYTVQAGLVFQEPIERRTQRGARDAATGLVAKARFTEADARTSVASSASIAITELASTRRRIEVLERAVKVAQLDVESEEARFQANRSTSFDVLRRQQALTDVRIRLLRAAVDNAKAASTIDALTDDILLRHGLAVRGTRGAS